MAQQDGRLDVAVIGVGRMGRHHARIYGQLPQSRLVAVVDIDLERAETIGDEYGCAAYRSTADLLDAHPHLEAASIAVPTRAHSDAARPLIQKRMACLIEKPLAPTVAEARQLAELARRYQVVLQVGHTERFNPAIRAVAAMEIKARFVEVNRVSPMSFRSLDVGVVMDMMIHDLDIVLMFARSPIHTIDAAGVAVLGEHEDVANARIVFKSGCVANLTASRLALKTERKLRLFSESAYVSLDYQRRSGIIIRRSDENLDTLERIRGQIALGADLSDTDYSSQVHVEELTMDLPSGEEDPLTGQLASFLDAARNDKVPAVDAAAGYAAVQAAEQVVAAIKQHKWEGFEGVQLILPEKVRT